MAIDPNLDLVLERTIDVPPALVWKAWTTPEHLEKWFCPKPWYATDFKMDLRPGGIFQCAICGPNGERMEEAPGCYLEVIPERKLVWTSALGPDYRPQTPPAQLDATDCNSFQFTAVVEMEPYGDGGCKYRAIAIHATPEASKAHRDMGFEQGWGTALDQLVELAKSWQ